MTRVTLLLSSLFLFAGCASVDVIGERETGSVTIQRSPADDPPQSPSGWIYAFDRASGQPDACVYVWRGNEWSVGYEIEPGFYGTEMARGSIRDGVAVDFPAGVLRDARTLYVAGKIGASLDERAIGRQSN